MIFAFFLLAAFTAALPDLLLYAGDEHSLQRAINSMFNESSAYCECTMNPRQIVFQALTNSSFDWESYVDEYCECDLPDNHKRMPPPEPVHLPGYLHALIDTRSKEVYGVSYNVSDLEQLLHTVAMKRNDISSNSTATLEILALTSENATTLTNSKKREVLTGTKTDFASPDVTKRDWSSVATWVVAYAAGGAVLHALDRHTQSGAVKRVYRAYAALGYDVAYFITDAANNIYQGFKTPRVIAGELSQLKIPCEKVQ